MRFVTLVAMLAVYVLTPAGVAAASPIPPHYLDYSTRGDILSGGVKMIPIETSKGTFHVWTKRVGNNPKIKVLLLHGGPGFNHEYLEAFDGYFPGAGIEYYYYDQLGSFFSDQPDEPDLWELPRFVEEVETVRKALGLGPDNFYLWGGSWGGLLAMEYALEYQRNLKGLIISNMVASIPLYNEYADKVFHAQMDPAVLAEIKKLEAEGDTENPRYMELLIPHHYEKHVLRMPFAEWPEPVQRAFKRVNYKVYVPMQGPSELGASGKLVDWDRMADLGKITVPTLMIGAQHDTMDPALMKRMAGLVKRGRYLYCENGSHLALYDDQKTYFDGLIRFIRDVDRGKFAAASEAEPSSPKAAASDSESSVALETLMKASLEVTKGVEVIVSRVTVPPGTSLPKHWHPGEEFAYVLEGSVVLWQEGKDDIVAKKGDVVKIPLKQVHTAITKDEGATILVFRVHEKGKPERVPVE